MKKTRNILIGLVTLTSTFLFAYWADNYWYKPGDVIEGLKGLIYLNSWLIMIPMSIGTRFMIMNYSNNIT